MFASASSWFPRSKIVNEQCANLRSEKISQPKAAELLNVSRRSVQSAKQVIERGTPERVVREIANWKTDMLNRYYHLLSKRVLESVQFKPKLVHSFVHSPEPIVASN